MNGKFSHLFIIYRKQNKRPIKIGYIIVETSTENTLQQMRLQESSISLYYKSHRRLVDRFLSSYGGRFILHKSLILFFTVCNPKIVITFDPLSNYSILNANEPKTKIKSSVT